MCLRELHKVTASTKSRGGSKGRFSLVFSVDVVVSLGASECLKNAFTSVPGYVRWAVVNKFT